MSTTGTTVIEWDGTFPECQKCIALCNYACCKFGDLGNWIFTLPGELEEAACQDLSRDHLIIEKFHGGERVTCNKPCHKGDFKPIDCAIYPFAPLNEELTLFLVGHPNKCPIPPDDLFWHLKKTCFILQNWETEHPGSIKALVEAAHGYKGYVVFPYRLILEASTVIPVTRQDIADLILPEILAGIPSSSK